MHNIFQFQLFRSNNGQWSWRLLSPNGRSVAWAGETYHNKVDAVHGMNLVKQYAPAAQLVDLTLA